VVIASETSERDHRGTVVSPAKDARGKRDFRVPSRVMTDHDTAATGTIDPAAEHPQREAVVAEAVSVIDEALTKMMQRELLSSGEVADILLDVRMLLTSR
jgi:hypothetical protein